MRALRENFTHRTQCNVRKHFATRVLRKNLYAVHVSQATQVTVLYAMRGFA